MALVSLLFAFRTPVHITPANDSLRCTNSILSTGAPYRGDPIADSDERGDAVTTRKIEGATAIAASLAVAVIGEARQRALRAAGQIVAVLVVLLAFGSISLNLAG